MKPKVYLETTIPSYLAARKSRDTVTAAHQQLTREWWDTRRAHFDLYVSEVVLVEATAGDPTEASNRMTVLQGIPILNQGPEADDLAWALRERGPLPPKAAVDALHIAIAVLNGIDFLLLTGAQRRSSSNDS